MNSHQPWLCSWPEVDCTGLLRPLSHQIKVPEDVFPPKVTEIQALGSYDLRKLALPTLLQVQDFYPLVKTLSGNLGIWCVWPSEMQALPLRWLEGQPRAAPPIPSAPSDSRIQVASLFQQMRWPHDSEPGQPVPPSSFWYSALLRGARAAVRTCASAQTPAGHSEPLGWNATSSWQLWGADDNPGGRAGKPPWSQLWPATENLLSLPSNGLFPSTILWMACPTPSRYPRMWQGVF